MPSTAEISEDQERKRTSNWDAKIKQSIKKVRVYARAPEELYKGKKREEKAITGLSLTSKLG